MGKVLKVYHRRAYPNRPKKPYKIITHEIAISTWKCDTLWGKLMREMQSKSTMFIALYTHMMIKKKTGKSKCCQGCGASEFSHTAARV